MRRNIVTEDLVWMLEAMGLRTGIDVEQLLEVRRQVQASVPNETMYGFLADAGLPNGFASHQGGRIQQNG